MEFSRRVSIDLHIHTTASDGTLTPAQVISLAHRLKLKAIAITDHDTVAGSKEALDSGIPPSLGFLTGVEISATPPPFYPGSGSFHLLGYAIRLDDPSLNKTLEKLQLARKNRNPAIINRLKELGISITLDEVRKEAGEGQLGRPHIAQLMVKKGVVASIDEAFDQFLGTGKPAYVDKQRVDCFKAIEMIRAAGGVPVLAHPGLLETQTENQVDELIGNLKKEGIQGMEVFYSGHTPNQTRFYAELAQRHDLLMTGGSDFHGTIQPEIKMGSGQGDLIVPYELYEKLKKPTVITAAILAGTPMEIEDPSGIEQQLKYEFKDKDLLQEALRHSSYVNEIADSDLRDNERLEFLGDAVLNLIVGHLLMRFYPELKEGDLSRNRANLVNESQLAKTARSVNLGAYILLGKGESQTQGREKNSILADTFEALTAAIYLDGGFETAHRIISNKFQSLIEQLDTTDNNYDYKSRLQERIQLDRGVMPNYTIIREDGPDHEKTFWVALTAIDIETEGSGKSKKAAEQDAARKALNLLDKDT